VNPAMFVRLEKIAQGGLRYSLFLYAIAILTSMAGMEIFGWLSAIFVLLLMHLRFWHPDVVKPPGVRFLLPVDFILIALYAVIIVGAALTPSAKADFVFVIGCARWIILYFLIRYGLREVWSESWSKYFPYFIAFGGIVGLYAIGQHFTGVDFLRSGGRAVQLYGYRD
jgi:hypothetical protein